MSSTTTSRDDRDPNNPNNKPATGYPANYPPPAHNSYNQHQNSAYPPPPAHNSYPTATAYPYTAAPPASYYNPNPYPPPPPPYYDQRRATFRRRLILAGIFILFLVGTITFIRWLILRPKAPDFRVDSATVTNFNTTDSTHVTGNWDIGFSVRNPNKKMSFFYDQIEASVFYNDGILADTMLAPFQQGTKNTTTLRAKFSAAGVYVDDHYVKRMLQDRSGGVVSFSVRIVSVATLKAKAWWPRRHLMRVICRGVKVAFNSTSSGAGALSGGSNHCEVYLSYCPMRDEDAETMSAFQSFYANSTCECHRD